MANPKSRNRSIKDFFTQKVVRDAPQLQDASSSSTPLAPSRTPSLQRGQATPTQITTTASAISNTSPVPPAQRTATTTSPEAQPPPTSQTSVNSGASKRVVSNGEQVVLNSDSDDDSLPELDWGPLTTNAKTTVPITRSKRTTTDVDDDGLRKPERRTKSKKLPFDHVVETAQKNKELERVIAEHKADLAKQVEEEPAPAFVLNEDVLGKAVQDEDPEQAHRLFLAMQRTNATHKESVFHLFDETPSQRPVKTRFPAGCLPDHRWTSSFRDVSSRDQAFMTGFAHQAFRLQELPEELASWMIDQICLDRSDALDLRYLEILEAHDNHLRTLLGRDRLDAIFRAIGCDMKILDSDAPVTPSDAHATNVHPLPYSLKSIVRLLRRAAPWLGTTARSRAFYILCHTILDDRVSTDPDVLQSIQDALEALVCHFVDNQKLAQGLSDVLPRLLAHITNPVLQRTLIYAMPAQSPLTAYLRRHMALSFALYPSVVDVPLSDPRVPAIIHTHLQTSPTFFVSKLTDYTFLAARMTLLDVAIGPGLLSVPYRPLLSPAPSPAGSSPVVVPIPAVDDVKEFNETVDGLAQHIKILGNSIVEAGAVTDLTILDAKDCVERLCSRLEHAVRIGGKKMHNVFGSDDNVKQLKVTDHFRRVAKAQKTALVRGIFDDEDEDVDDVDRAVAAQIETEHAA